MRGARLLLPSLPVQQSPPLAHQVPVEADNGMDVARAHYLHFTGQPAPVRPQFFRTNRDFPGHPT